MIGLVIVTHGRLAEEFVSAMEHVVGPQRLVEAVCIGPDDNMENRRQDIIKAVAAAEMGDGVIVLTDMFGGTPSNLAISILEEANIEVIAGVNLPLLVKLASVRKFSDMATAVTEVCDAGRKYIKLASDVLDVPAG
jgi:PTS system mannose-specific IIA component